MIFHRCLCILTSTRIRIQLFTLMRMRSQFKKKMRIHTDSDPQPCQHIPDQTSSSPNHAAKKMDNSNLSGNAVVGPGAVVELTDSPLLLLPALASPLQSNNRNRDMNLWGETWILKLISPVHFNLTIATGIRVMSRDLNIKANVASLLQSNNSNREMNLWEETWILKLRLPRILPNLWIWI